MVPSPATETPAELCKRNLICVIMNDMGFTLAGFQGVVLLAAPEGG